jgi:hypothetical protein
LGANWSDAFWFVAWFPAAISGDAVDLAQVFIFVMGWVFFAAWGMVLAAVSVIAFGRDILAFTGRDGEKERPWAER